MILTALLPFLSNNADKILSFLFACQGLTHLANEYHPFRVETFILCLITRYKSEISWMEFQDLGKKVTLGS